MWKSRILAAILIRSLLVMPGYAQLTLTGAGRGTPSVGFPAITIGVSCTGTATGATSVACSSMTPALGSVIACGYIIPTGSTFTQIADDKNSGVYQNAFAGIRDFSDHNFELGAYYKENVAASATVITMTYATSGNSKISCFEIIGTPATYALDSSVTASQAANGTNPNSGTSLTPFANNAIVATILESNTSTPTAGFGTLIGNISTLWPQYGIQTTKTATTGNYTNASAVNYSEGMVAFGQNAGGTCNATHVFNWNGTGAANGVAVDVTKLQASTSGGAAQPNADRISNRPGWTHGAGTGTTFSTAAYQPLVTTRTCPFFTGVGTGTLGLSHASGDTTSQSNYYFKTNQAKVTLATCFSTTTPVANTGTLDYLVIGGGDNSVGNPDFAVLQINSNGAVGTFQLEDSGATTAVSTTHWTPNTQFWVRLEYNQANLHKLYIYSGCGASPTLLETVTGTVQISDSHVGVTGGGTADYFGFIGVSDSYIAGTATYIPASVGDILYGATLLP